MGLSFEFVPLHHHDRAPKSMRLYKAYASFTSFRSISFRWRWNMTPVHPFSPHQDGMFRIEGGMKEWKGEKEKKIKREKDKKRKREKGKVK
jgi:hypothetical protein